MNYIYLNIIYLHNENIEIVEDSKNKELEKKSGFREKNS